MSFFISKLHLEKISGHTFFISLRVAGGHKYIICLDQLIAILNNNEIY